MRQERDSGSKDVMVSMPLFPLRVAFQNSSMPTPLELTAPNPATTTRRCLGWPLFPFILTLHAAKCFSSRITPRKRSVKVGPKECRFSPPPRKSHIDDISRPNRPDYWRIERHRSTPRHRFSGTRRHRCRLWSFTGTIASSFGGNAVYQPAICHHRVRRGPARSSSRDGSPCSLQLRQDRYSHQQRRNRHAQAVRRNPDRDHRIIDDNQLPGRGLLHARSFAVDDRARQRAHREYLLRRRKDRYIEHSRLLRV